MATSFARFDSFMSKILYDSKIEPSIIATYFWSRLTEEYKRKYRIVTAERCLINNENALKLFTQLVHLRKFLPIGDFAKEIWENATQDFRVSWDSVPDEILLLTNLFGNQLNL